MRPKNLFPGESNRKCAKAVTLESLICIEHPVTTTKTLSRPLGARCLPNPPPSRPSYTRSARGKNKRGDTVKEHNFPKPLGKSSREKHMHGTPIAFHFICERARACISTLYTRHHTTAAASVRQRSSACFVLPDSMICLRRRPSERRAREQTRARPRTTYGILISTTGAARCRRTRGPRGTPPQQSDRTHNTKHARAPHFTGARACLPRRRASAPCCCVYNEPRRRARQRQSSKLKLLFPARWGRFALLPAEAKKNMRLLQVSP